MKTRKKESGKKKVEKKEKDEIWTNTIGKKFNITKLKKYLKDFDWWLLGNHMGMRPMMSVRHDYLGYLSETLDGDMWNSSIPSNYIDTCHFIDNIKGGGGICGIGNSEIKHAVRLTHSVLQWCKSIKLDYGVNIFRMANKELGLKTYDEWKKSKWYKRWCKDDE